MTRIAIQDGFSMCVHDAGTGMPIILLHGYCGSSGYWKDIEVQLASDYRMIVPDLRGHGKTDAPNGSYTIDQMADDILQLADKLELDQFVLLGHSLGGYVTLSVAERFSDRLLGWGLIHSTAYADSEEAKENRLKAVETIRTNGIVPFIDGLVPKLFHQDKLDERREWILEAISIGYHTSPYGAIGAALAMRERPDRTQVLAESRLPILLVAGEGDKVVPKERLFTVDGDHVMKRSLAEAGHMGMMETPEEMADTIRDFMNDYVLRV